MFEIYGGKAAFDQWDLNQRVTCSCLKWGDPVVFYAHGKRYAVTAYEDGGVWANVPNFLLQKHGSVRVDLGHGLNAHLDCRTYFDIVKKDKPADYVCESNIKIESDAGGGSGGGTSDAVQYIPQELTEEQQMQARKNLGLYRSYLGKGKRFIGSVAYYSSQGWIVDGGNDLQFEDVQASDLGGWRYLFEDYEGEIVYDVIIKASGGQTWEAQIFEIFDDYSGIYGWWVGNYSLIPDDEIDIHDPGTSVDCPVALYWDTSKLRIYVDPNYNDWGDEQTGFGFYRVGDEQEMVDPIDRKYMPKAEAVSDANEYDEEDNELFVSGEKFNELLDSLRSAGYLSW